MNITVLGGAEIGATCLWFRTASTEWLVDAGTRMDERDPLPALSLLEEGHANIQAIFITHAHQDHIGALPLISSLYPNAPVYMTQPTLDIARVMLADALHLSQLEGHARIFTEAQLESLWDRVRVMGQDKAFRFENVRVSTYSAGHILGAVALGFETEDEGSVLFTGDYSVAPGRLISGLRLPHGTHYDAVLTESTYGSRLHSPRAQQESDLVDQISAVIGQGGFVLIPAFAVGRAQEVLIILQDALRYRKDLRPFPLVVDGLVRRICPIYESYPHLLHGSAKRTLHTKGRLFAPEDITFIRSPEQRNLVLQGKPACIVTSSGMLSGGPALFYAGALLDQTNNAVFLTGYQDEESPGRLLLRLAEQDPSERRWILPDRVVPVRAKVGLYALSAHADRRELAHVVAEVRPRHVWLVHGDAEAKAGLAREIHAHLPACPVENALVGRTYEVQGTSVGRLELPDGDIPIRAASWKRQVLAFRAPGGPLQLGYCTRQSGGTCTVHMPDGSEQRIPVAFVQDALGRIPPGETPSAYLEGLVAAAQACLDSGRYFGVRAAERLAYLLAEEQGALSPIDPYGKDAVAEQLAPYGFRKIESDPNAQTFRVFVSFPWAIPASVRDAIEGTRVHGWTYRIEDQVYPPALQKLVEAHLPGVSMQPPKLFPLEKRLVIPILEANGGLDEDAIARALTKVVGGTVQVVRAGQAKTNGRLEQNEAIHLVQERVPNRFGLHKVGLDLARSTLKLSVFFPDALPYPETRELAASLEQETGWKVEWTDKVHLEKLTQVATQAIQAVGGTLLGPPSLHTPKKLLVQRISRPLPEDAKEAARHRFQEMTGWQLQCEEGSSAKASPMPSSAPVQGGRMELNRALLTVERRFADEGVPIYKKSVRGDRIEVTFLTPEFGQTQQDVLAALEDGTGWPMAVSDRVQQQALIRLAEDLVPGLPKTPSVYLMERTVGVRGAVSQEAKEAFYAASRWTLRAE
ncbi:MBL fold metallo-hydrolase [Alicyclobacillus sp. SP_1]|uniref:MBL fold metallo-hydrolase n=1 Tax=Alicyclobacillus sp. SP_1 TaxID=2942475 RepID=UPI0021579059|nr:MBL fold metallo-hydrolase [Alicyclobacillus sp. SP_1]